LVVVPPKISENHTSVIEGPMIYVRAGEGWERREPRRDWTTALFGHPGVALPAESNQTKNPKARKCILRSDGRKGNSI